MDFSKCCLIHYSRFETFGKIDRSWGVFPSFLLLWILDCSLKNHEDSSLISSLICNFDDCGSTSANTKFSSDVRRLTAVEIIILGTIAELNDSEWWGLSMENVPRESDGYQLAKDKLCR
jgi:hypothetical protein